MNFSATVLMMLHSTFVWVCNWAILCFCRCAKELEVLVARAVVYTGAIFHLWYHTNLRAHKSRGTDDLEQLRQTSDSRLQLTGILRSCWHKSSTKTTPTTPYFIILWSPYCLKHVKVFFNIQAGSFPKPSQMVQNYQQPPTFLSITIWLMTFHHWGPPLRISMLWDFYLNKNIETCKLSVWLAAVFYIKLSLF